MPLATPVGGDNDYYYYYGWPVTDKELAEILRNPEFLDWLTAGSLRKIEEIAFYGRLNGFRTWLKKISGYRHINLLTLLDYQKRRRSWKEGVVATGNMDLCGFSIHDNWGGKRGQTDGGTASEDPELSSAEASGVV